MSTAPLHERLLAGERQAVARALSRVEQQGDAAAALCRALAPHLGRAHVLGITGAPGAGKSTLVHALLGALLARGQRIGVIAVDPSSPISGGAVLGDRVRMGEHGAHPEVFIRSVAARGHLGGLSRTTAAMVDVLDAAGFDVVIVETVGAGQSEVAIVKVADTRIVACPPGLGDEVQAIKAGILEIADLLVVTKADLSGAAATARDLKDMLHLRAAVAPGAWSVPVLSTSASRGDGVAELVEQIDAHAHMAGRGRRLGARGDRAGDSAGDNRGGPGANRGDGEPGQVIDHLEGFAQRVARLAGSDPFVRLLGIECVSGGEGVATVSLVLRGEHLNFNGGCHGGVIFALADTAFGLASNSRGVLAVGIDAHITYQRAARLGQTLLARAAEVSRTRRLAVYRVDVTSGDGQPVSSFTGTVYLATKAAG